MISRRRLRLGLLSLALLLAAPGAGAQQVPGAQDPLARWLFEPELIMKHRRAINLSDEQRDAISRLIRDLQGKVVSLQWELQEQMEGLSSELSKTRVDLDRAQDRMGRVLQTERRIKEAHLQLLVSIKNVLRADQQEALRKLKADPAATSDDR